MDPTTLKIMLSHSTLLKKCEISKVGLSVILFLKDAEGFSFDVAHRYKGASGSSAVCAFTMAQVERAFSGRYREVNRETQQWYTYNHPVPEPRPGAVSAALFCSLCVLYGGGR